MTILAFTLIGLGALLLIGSTVAVIGGAGLASPAGMANLLSLPLLGIGACLATVAGVSMTIALLAIGAVLAADIVLSCVALMLRSASVQH